MSGSKNKKKSKGSYKTTYYSSRSETSKKPFHSPQAYGKLIEIPMTPLLRAVSAVSLIVQGVLTVLTIYAVSTSETIAALENTGYASSLIYLLFPFVTWFLTLGFRFICKKVPLDMWRLPKKVRKGMVLCKGTLLKLVTLLAVLETAICFCYIIVILYLGGSPANLALIIWIAALVLSVWLPCRKAARMAREETEIKKNSF